MEGTSSGLAGLLDDNLPKRAQFVLAWNPRKLLTEGDSEADVTLPTREPPDTDPSALRTTATGTTRKAAFYDKHLAPHLILESVVCFDKLVHTMANAVDQAIQDAVSKRPLPKDTGMLQSEKVIKYQVRGLFQQTKYYESGVAETYSHHAAMYCLPIASTLALHPSSEHWDSILNWTTDGKIGRWAIADGVLRISPDIFKTDQWEKELLQNEHDRKKGIIKQLANDATAARVMKEIVGMGQTPPISNGRSAALPAAIIDFWRP